MFGTGGFGSGSVFPTVMGLGTSASLGGNPLLGGLVCIHSSTKPYKGALIDRGHNFNIRGLLLSYT
jgi:hypothetical protein